MPDAPPAPPRVAALVLAAGAGTRFGGPHGSKLLADLDGRPVLAHVLDGLAAAGLGEPVLVVSTTLAAALARAGGTSMGGSAPHVVVNPHPGLGLASSLRIGWAAAVADPSAPEAILIALGDQPRVPAGLLARLAAAPLDPTRPVVAVRWSAGAGPNPVRLEVAAGALVAETEGDRGLGPVIAAHPELVRWIDASGDNPDVDRPSDLAALASGAPRRA